jgi:hypothetical protein
MTALNEFIKYEDRLSTNSSSSSSTILPNTTSNLNSSSHASSPTSSASSSIEDDDDDDNNNEHDIVFDWDEQAQQIIHDISEQRLQPQQIAAVLGKECCINRCLHSLSFNGIRSLRIAIYAQSQAQQLQYLTQYFLNVLQQGGQLTIDGQAVCEVNSILYIVHH